MFITFSKNAHILSPLKVTDNQTGIPLLILKLDIAFFANLTTGCCQEIKAKSCFNEV
jgi:hypothetical protein